MRAGSRSLDIELHGPEMLSSLPKVTQRFGGRFGLEHSNLCQAPSPFRSLLSPQTCNSLLPGPF